MTEFRLKIDALDGYIKALDSIARNLALITPGEIIHMLDADPKAIRAKGDLLKQMRTLYEEINTDILDGLSYLDSHWEGLASEKFVNEFMGRRFPQFVTKVCKQCEELEQAATDVANKLEESQEQVVALVVGSLGVIGSAIAIPALLPLVGVAVAGLVGSLLGIVGAAGGLLAAKVKLLTVLDEVTGAPKVGAVTIDRTQTGVPPVKAEAPADGAPLGWAPDPDPHTD